MKLKTIVAIVAAVLGLGASAQAYRMASAPAAPDTKPVAAHAKQQDKAAAPQVKVPTIIPATRFQWAPCQPPAVQKGDDCVTEVVQTIVIPSTPAPASSGSSGSGEHHSTGGGRGGDDSAGDDDDQGEDDDSDEPDDGEDHGDDDGGEFDN